MKELKKSIFLLLVIALFALCLAGCASKTYTVTFHTGDDTSITSKVSKGDKAIEPKVECAPDVEVEGWYTQREGGEKFDFQTSVTGDIELWARYQKAYFTVTYVMSADESVTETVRANGRTTEPKAECADGVYVEGWYTSDTFNPATKYDFDSVVNKDVTLYPNYVNKAFSVSFSYAVDEMTDPAGGSFDKDGEITFPAAENRIGYVFKGWSDGKGLYLNGDSYPIADNLRDLAFVAVWEYKTVTVRFFGEDGAMIGEELTVPYASQVIAPDENAAMHRLFPLYRLSGWDSDLTMVTEDLDVCALYTYQASDLSLFEFKLNADGDGYIVSKAADAEMPNAIAIPDSYENLPVVAIADYGFDGISFAYGIRDNNYEIVGTTAVILPDSIQTIGKNAFGRNAFLRTITTFDTNERFTSIADDTMLVDADGALVWASLTLSEVVIPQEVTSIRDTALFFGGYRIHPTTGISYTFDNAVLQKVTIKSDLEKIPSSTFGTCKNLAEVEFDGGTVKIVEGYDESGVYDDATDARNKGAFAISGGKLKSISFPEGLMSIGTRAFEGQRLTSVSLPASLTTMGLHALTYSTSNNNSFQTFTLAEGNSNFVLDEGFAFIQKETDGDKLLFCVSGKENVGAYSIPATVASFAEKAFSGAQSMTSVTVPENITALSKGMFEDCMALTSVQLPSTLESIAENAFSGCFMLEEINLSETSVATIGSGAFVMCSSLTAVNLPLTVEQIGAHAFMNCDMLTSINAAAGSEYFSTSGGMLCSADGKTLLICPVGLIMENNGAFVTPAGVENVAGELLNNMFGIQTIEFSEGVKVVGSNFAPYTTAMTVTFPTTIEEICYGAFNGNRSATVYVFKGAAIPYVDCPLHTFGNSSSPERTQVRFAVPVEVYSDWYDFLFIHGLSGKLDTVDGTLPRTNFRFVNTDGENLSNIQGASVSFEPLPVCATEGKYFAGWWTQDGSVDGDWGERVVFPVTGIDGETFNMYARWENARVKDGRSLQTAYEVEFNDWSKLTLSDGRWFVRVKNIQATANSGREVFIHFDVSYFDNVVWFNYFEDAESERVAYTVAAMIVTASSYQSYPFDVNVVGEKYEAVFMFEIKNMAKETGIWFSAQFAINIYDERYISQPV